MSPIPFCGGHPISAFPLKAAPNMGLITFRLLVFWGCLLLAFSQFPDQNTESLHLSIFPFFLFFYHYTSSHYGTKPGHFEKSKIHFPTREGVSEVSERANERAQRRARAKRAVRSKQTSEWCERTSERTSEWPSTSVCIPGCFGPQ